LGRKCPNAFDVSGQKRLQDCKESVLDSDEEEAVDEESSDDCSSGDNSDDEEVDDEELDVSESQSKLKSKSTLAKILAGAKKSPLKSPLKTPQKATSSQKPKNTAVKKLSEFGNIVADDNTPALKSPAKKTTSATGKKVTATTIPSSPSKKRKVDVDPLKRTRGAKKAQVETGNVAPTLIVKPVIKDILDSLNIGQLGAVIEASHNEAIICVEEEGDETEKMSLSTVNVKSIHQQVAEKEASLNSVPLDDASEIGDDLVIDEKTDANSSIEEKTDSESES
jgi:hypothetical protein